MSKKKQQQAEKRRRAQERAKAAQEKAKSSTRKSSVKQHKKKEQGSSSKNQQRQQIPEREVMARNGNSRAQDSLPNEGSKGMSGKRWPHPWSMAAAAAGISIAEAYEETTKTSGAKI